MTLCQHLSSGFCCEQLTLQTRIKRHSQIYDFDQFSPTSSFAFTVLFHFEFEHLVTHEAAVNVHVHVSPLMTLLMKLVNTPMHHSSI